MSHSDESNLTLHRSRNIHDIKRVCIWESINIIFVEILCKMYTHYRRVLNWRILTPMEQSSFLTHDIFALHVFLSHIFIKYITKFSCYLRNPGQIFFVFKKITLRPWPFNQLNHANIAHNKDCFVFLKVLFVDLNNKQDMPCIFVSPTHIENVFFINSSLWETRYSGLLWNIEVDEGNISCGGNRCYYVYFISQASLIKLHVITCGPFC